MNAAILGVAHDAMYELAPDRVAPPLRSHGHRAQECVVATDFQSRDANDGSLMPFADICLGNEEVARIRVQNFADARRGKIGVIQQLLDRGQIACTRWPNRVVRCNNRRRIRNCGRSWLSSPTSLASSRGRSHS
jgi:hypothetical protein